MRQLDKVRAQADRLARQMDLGATPVPLSVPGLGLMRAQQPGEITHSVYDPIFCMVVQGAKSVHFDREAVMFRAGHGVIVSHELPGVNRVVEATPQAPYLAAAVTLDPGLLRDLAPRVSGQEPARALSAAPLTPAVVDVMGRLLGLLEADGPTEVLAELYLRELHALLLAAPEGAMLRRLTRPDAPEAQVARALRLIRGQATRPLSIETLARESGMSATRFHRHFRAITGTTPLQYQKRLRLIEARRLLRETGSGVTQAALRVGYESPTQFSRDFRRLFGHAPREARGQDLR
ncbi:AraC family transcriptional regulator [Pseudooceanicola sp. 200-1SW]|uniref:AraC family transcriptional regulator n=1 Tax=Pseudooceanicola sp. 200-1SW TaxID=3425949 RepID=UPI003D7FD695